jgi:hypothetical protein
MRWIVKGSIVKKGESHSEFRSPPILRADRARREAQKRDEIGGD